MSASRYLLVAGDESRHGYFVRSVARRLHELYDPQYNRQIHPKFSVMPLLLLRRETQSPFSILEHVPLPDLARDSHSVGDMVENLIGAILTQRKADHLALVLVGTLDEPPAPTAAADANAAWLAKATGKAPAPTGAPRRLEGLKAWHVSRTGETTVLLYVIERLSGELPRIVDCRPAEPDGTLAALQAYFNPDFRDNSHLSVMQATMGTEAEFLRRADQGAPNPDDREEDA